MSPGDWILGRLLGPTSAAVAARDAWRPEFVGLGYRVERRVAADDCLVEAEEEVLAPKLDAP